ncbi:MAG: type II toxin-antitoxin system VapB family antitoxin [Nitrospirae bacterium]|nr:type II toxin-antitoxin system VapB family antitoxin [Nitrospirota bacterium]
MRTTLSIDDKLINEARELAGVKTKREVVEIALSEFIKRRQVRQLTELEGKITLSFTLDEFLSARLKDLPEKDVSDR